MKWHVTEALRLRKAPEESWWLRHRALISMQFVVPVWLVGSVSIGTALAGVHFALYPDTWHSSMREYDPGCPEMNTPMGTVRLRALFLC